MAGSRYQLIQESFWQWLGPAYKGLDADLKAVETTLASGGGAGGGGGIITSGPYTLDPKRAPAGAIVAIPESAPILTHVGTRFGTTTAGSPLPTTTTTYDTAQLRKTGTGTTQFETGGLFGKSLAVTATATAAETVQATWSPPSGAVLRETQMSFVARFPRPGSDVTVLSVYRTAATALTVLVWPGAAGYTKLIVNDPTIAGWEYTSPDFLASSTVRIAVASQWVNGTGTSKVKVGFFQVNADGTETQIGTTYENAAVNVDGTGQALASWQFGRNSTNAGTEALTYRLDAYRLAYGTGAYSLGLLRDERLYPAPV